MSESGWIRRNRINQGLKGYQLAELLEVSAARISVLEKDETRGAVTLKMMAKVAKAMGCRFEYQIVPDGKNATNITNAKPRYRVVDNQVVANSKSDIRNS
jgi:transcriptional regulator with XRE-family HTH domain